MDSNINELSEEGQYSEEEEAIDINHPENLLSRKRVLSASSSKDSSTQESVQEEKKYLPLKYRNQRFLKVIPFKYESDKSRFIKTQTSYKVEFTLTKVDKIFIELGKYANIIKKISFFFVFSDNSNRKTFFGEAKQFFSSFYSAYNEHYYFIGGNLKNKPCVFITNMINEKTIKENKILYLTISFYDDFENLWLDCKEHLGEGAIDNANGFDQEHNFDVSFFKEMRRKVKHIFKYRESMNS